MQEFNDSHQLAQGLFAHRSGETAQQSAAKSRTFTIVGLFGRDQRANQFAHV
jgi:hypothetical protein